MIEILVLNLQIVCQSENIPWSELNVRVDEFLENTAPNGASNSGTCTDLCNHLDAVFPLFANISKPLHDI